MIHGVIPRATLVLAATAALLIACANSPTDTVSASADASAPARASGISRAASTSLAQCHVKELPKQARQQITAILQDLPSDDGEHDGKHFGNYEKLLPKRSSSYYREYTVKTPGLNHRGERRIVVGGGSRTDPDVWYYTQDHFESFCSIPDAETSPLTTR